LQTAEPSTNEVQQFIVDVVGSRRPNKWPTLRDVERELIMKILKESAWNKPQAAEALGINRLKLWWKLRQYARTP
jgi:DNA-binding NtrC family response regulator